MPTDLPDLRRVGIISIDLETKDGGISADIGSAWPWGDGYICGVSVAYRAEGEIRAHYFPIRHPDTDNFDASRVHEWLKDLIASDVRFITQNGLYDWGWLRTEAGILMPPSDRLEEIGALATIVDENRFRYSLDALCTWRGLPGKDETLLREAVKAAGFKITKNNPLQSYIWRMPARVVGPYAEADAANTLALRESLDPILDKEGTRAAYRLEVDLLPMVLEMRLRGIRVDTGAAERARDELLAKRDAVFAELSEKLGVLVGMEEIGRNKWLAATFDAQGITYPRTEKGAPSFTAGSTGWMHKHEHWLPRLIVKADRYNNAAMKFLESYVLGHAVNGRVHAEIHPHRSDDGGARSLRFSYSAPPLQQMTAHDEELAPLIRGVFLPEEGEVWAKPDISQQEFRLIVHYAIKHGLSRAKEAADLYRNDPDTDFHQMVSDWTGLARQSAKNTNFAKAFGAGVRKFALMVGRTENEARAIYTKYDRELPFVSQLAAICQSTAAQRGYIELYDGARRHWDQWEAPAVAWTKGIGPCSRQEAERRIADPTHPWYRRGIRRAETHKAMNALIQGSAARHTKLWMRACFREGIIPLLQMHDSLDCSVSSPEIAERVAQLGREAVKLEVPIQTDLKFGRSWGDAKHTWAELHGIEPAPAPARKPQSQPVAVEKPKEPPPTLPVQEGLPVVNGVAATPGAGADPQQDQIRIEIPHLADFIDLPFKGDKVCCPFHDDRTPSCHIYPDHFYCFGCAAHGDAIDWLMMVDGLDREAAIERWKCQPTPSPRRNVVESDTDTLATALQLWEQAEPIAGTLAERYLAETRGIDVAALPVSVDEVLRFHPCCPFDGARPPCLVALFRDVATDVPAGIERIALTPEALAGGKGKTRRFTLGRWQAPRAIKLWPAAGSLVIGEGIETVLAAATRIVHRDAPLQPAWAIGSKDGFASFPLIAGIEHLTLLADNDANGGGLGRAEECAQRWAAIGRAVDLLITEKIGTDFNDLIRVPS